MKPIALALVDFEPTIAQEIERVLSIQELPFTVERAFHPSAPAPLVLLNGRAPGLLDKVHLIRQHSPLSEILLITFHRNYQLLLKAMRAGVRDVIEYPLNPSDMMATLYNSLHLYRLAMTLTAGPELHSLTHLFGDARRYPSLESFCGKIEEYVAQVFSGQGPVILKWFTDPAVVSCDWNESCWRHLEQFTPLLPRMVEQIHQTQQLATQPLESSGRLLVLYPLGKHQELTYAALLLLPSQVERDQLHFAMLAQLGQLLFMRFQQFLFQHITQELTLLTHIDDVTGLYNQRRLTLDLKRLLETAPTTVANEFALLFVDLDHFKKINDTYGHQVGGHLLVETAKELRKMVRENDLLYRYGGDEFVVLLTQTTLDQAYQIGERIIERFRQARFRRKQNDPIPFFEDLQLSLSIGLAHYPSDGITLEVLLHYADTMMYEAKKQGRGQIHYCSLKDSSRPKVAPGDASPRL